MSLAPQIRRRGLFTEAQFQGFLDRIAELTRAEKVERATREPGKPQVYVNVADNVTRLGALKLAVELEIGKAPQALELTLPPGGNGSVPTANDAITLLNANPSLARAILGSLFETMKSAQKAGTLREIIDLPESKGEKESNPPPR